MPPKPLKRPKWKPPKEVNLPDEKYIVVVKPWIGSSNPAFFKALGGWLECASVQFPPNVDIKRLLGSHRPSEFVKGEPKFDNIRKNNQITVIYEYNYRVHGDPSNKGWDSEYPYHGSVQDSPFKQGVEYPCPRLAPRTPDEFTCNVALPIPRDILEQLEAREATLRATEERAAAEKEASRAAATAVVNRTPPRDLPPPPSNPSHASTPDPATTFTPYVPPSHLYPNPNSGIVQLPQATPQPSSSGTPQPQIGKIGKMDPYEEEEEAKFLLQAGPVVKTEDTTFNENTQLGPSETRVNEDTSDHHRAILNHHTHTPPDAIKPEPAEPSEELRQLHDQYLALQANGCGPTVKAEARENSLRIKQEPSNVTIQGSGAHPKAEPVDAYLPQAMNHGTPSGGAKRGPPVDRVTFPGRGIVKREKEEGDDQIPRAEDERSSVPGWRRRRERNADAVFGDDSGLNTSANAQVKHEGPAVKPEPQDRHDSAHVHIKEEKVDDHQQLTKHEYKPSISSRTAKRNTEGVSRDEQPYKKPRMDKDGSSFDIHVKHERRSVKPEYDDHRSSLYRPSDRDRARPHTLTTPVKSEPRDSRRPGDQYSYGSGASNYHRR